MDANKPLRLVPFNSTWIQHDKIDVHAIYRRPRWIKDEYDEDKRQFDANGLALWDITGPLPVRRHNDWTKKGYEYVTLANRDALLVAARFGTLPEGTSVRDFDQHQTGGPWNYRKYIEGRTDIDSAALRQLAADVDKYGSDIVMEIRRGGDEKFELPKHLQGIAHPTMRGKVADPQEPKAEQAKTAVVAELGGKGKKSDQVGA